MHKLSVADCSERGSGGHLPLTFWLTGLSGAGKTTLACGLNERFKHDGIASVILDGDVIRSGLCSDLGFSPRDRSENIRRTAEVARLFNLAGMYVFVAFISPFASDRERARATIGADRFVEVHVSTPLAACEARDPKGLYARARKNEIPEFTGLTSPYEVPVSPQISIDTSIISVDEAVDRVLAWLSGRGAKC